MITASSSFSSSIFFQAFASSFINLIHGLACFLNRLAELFEHTLIYITNGYYIYVFTPKRIVEMALSAQANANETQFNYRARALRIFLQWVISSPRLPGRYF